MHFSCHSEQLNFPPINELELNLNFSHCEFCQHCFMGVTTRLVTPKRLQLLSIIYSIFHLILLELWC